MTCFLIWRIGLIVVGLLAGKERRRGQTSLVMAKVPVLGGIRRGWEGFGLACHMGNVYGVAK